MPQSPQLLSSILKLLVVVAIILPFYAYGQVGDFVLEPARVEIDGKLGQSVQKSITITSRIPGEAEFKIYVEDVLGSDDKDQAVYINEKDSGFESPFSLKKYVKLNQSSVTLREGERTTVNFTVDLPENLPGGGLYGSILVEGGARKANGPGSGVMTISRVGTILLVKVPGESHYEANLQDFNLVPSGFFHNSLPASVEIGVLNEGNIHTVGYGSLLVSNIFGKDVASAKVEPFVALPQSTRWVYPEIKAQGFSFGLYTITLDLALGYDNKTEQMKRTVLVVPWTIIGLFIVIILGIAYFFKRK